MFIFDTAIKVMAIWSLFIPCRICSVVKCFLALMVGKVDSRLFFPQDDQPGQERAWQAGQPWLDRRPGGHPRLLDQRGVRRWRQRTHHWRWTGDFFHLLPKRGTNFYVCLIEGAARVFPTSYAPTGNWTHVSSGTLIQDTLRTEQLWLLQVNRWLDLFAWHFVWSHWAKLAIQILKWLFRIEEMLLRIHLYNYLLNRSPTCFKYLDSLEQK